MKHQVLPILFTLAITLVPGVLSFAKDGLCFEQFECENATLLVERPDATSSLLCLETCLKLETSGCKWWTHYQVSKYHEN